MDNQNYLFISNDNKTYSVSKKIQNMFKAELPKNDKIQLPISSYTLEHILKYCEHHDYESPSEIKRPLNDDLKMNIDDNWDYLFINELSMDNVTKLLSEGSQLGCLSFQDLCLVRLSLMIRNAGLGELMQYFKVNTNEFTNDIMMKIFSEQSSLMTMDDERVKEFLNDNL